MLVEFWDRGPNLMEDKNQWKWGLGLYKVFSRGNTLQSLSVSHESKF